VGWDLVFVEDDLGERVRGGHGELGYSPKDRPAAK
jgi:hypothetical protein